MQTLVHTKAPRCELLAFFERASHDIQVNDLYELILEFIGDLNGDPGIVTQAFHNETIIRSAISYRINFLRNIA